MYSGLKDDLLVQVLPVDDSNDAFDLNRIPTSGSEYLQRVRAEAQQYEDVKVVQVRKHKNKQDVLKINKDKVDTRPELLANLDWQVQKIKDFSEIRLKYEGYKLLKKNSTKKKKTISISDSPEACSKYLYGEADAQIKGHDPLLSIVMHFDQALVEALLAMHVEWLAETGFSHEMGRWIYSLLVAFEKPLSPDACWTLRRLAKQCAKTRNSMRVGSSELAGVNLIICLVAKYFDQADLADQQAV